MTVIVNCRFLTRPITGVERFAEELVTELTSLRNDLTLLSPARVALRSDEIGGVPVTRVGALTGHAWEQVSLRRELARRGRPLLVSLANTGPVGYRRQVVAVHDATHRRHPESYSWRFRHLYAVITPRLARDSAAVVTVSDFSRRELNELYGPTAPIYVIPNAVGDWMRSPNPGPPNPPPQEPYFLVVGSGSPHKNLTTARSAFREYRAAGGLSGLVVVGSSNGSFATSERDSVDGEVALGRVTDETLAWLYSHARAFVFPSLYEGFGIPPLEAQAAGTPVVASDIPVLREVMSHPSVLWFPPTDAQALAAALHRLDFDERLRRELVDEGAKNVSRFSWRSSAEALSRVIDEVGSG